MIRTAVVLGLVSGVTESLIRLLRSAADPDGVKLGAYLGWMPATANGLLCQSVALVLAPFAWWKPALVTGPHLILVGDVGVYPGIDKPGHGSGLAGKGCVGELRLTGGTGPFAGITGSGAMVVRTVLTAMAADLRSGEVVKGAAGLAVWPKLTYRTPDR